jgi:hypothetical protein
MLELKLDLSQFERRSTEMDAQIRQLPFALSKSLNEAAKQTRKYLVDELWPSHVAVRNSGFLNAALTTNFSTKQDLTVQITNDRIPDRGHLPLHDEGGTKIARRRLAIPSMNIRRGAHGPVASQTPKAIIANTPKRALRVTARGILVGKGGKLKLMYTFTPSARIKQDVPFSETFADRMTRGLRKAFPLAMAKAMMPRR